MKMGRARYIYFTDENDEWLEAQPKGSRAGVINKLIDEHKRKIELDDLSEEELKIELEKAKAKKEFEDKLKKIENGDY